MTPIHPARAMSFHALVAALDARIAAGAVTCARQGPLSLYIYTRRCVYDQLWDDVAVLARGLVLDHERGLVRATPFPKFFNLGERNIGIPAEPFEVYEKLDGSLAIVFHDGDRWRAVTKGAFDSAQARWAEAWLGARELSPLVPGTTYLFEIIYAANRIVVPYDDEGLVLLAAYDDAGSELRREDLAEAAARIPCALVEAHSFESVRHLLAEADTLGRRREGFVVRFASGLRMKIKGAAYRRIHAMISDTTPLGLWRAMDAGDDLDAFRAEIPEEFWSDFDRIRDLLGERIARIRDAVEAEHARWQDVPDRELGPRLGEVAADARPFLFTRRRRGDVWLQDVASRQTLHRMIKPSGNELPGYAPSTYILGAQDEG
jgi:RNA ligase